ncbi:uncharacterized protein LAJ45_05435 [Morchella importuna]|uniref:uncharacterized protein n=1 Tax=Morchella importuna TaxID=1174673 RepID=UPI001E8E710D|nr:uncharacterized protein LAJ45_05435 [Morchella importuna]KAH8150739.1 hypothetical protein LAJ45_05435 [Morchella importuna]
MTIRFIRKNTTTPIPEIIKFDYNSENEIASPYMMMRFAEGSPVCQLCWDETGPTPLEECRHRILDNIASAMSQLSQFTYQKIGSLQFAEDPRYSLSILPNIGPINIIDEEAEMEQLDSEADTCAVFKSAVVFKNIGPFTSSQEYITALLDAQPPPDDSYSLGMQNLLRMMIKNLPLSRPVAGIEGSGIEGFELSHPDFSGQNFLASEDGTLTAAIDWDDVHTVPAWIGCCAYPAWLTRDWDPRCTATPRPSVKTPQRNSTNTANITLQRWLPWVVLNLPSSRKFTKPSALLHPVPFAFTTSSTKYFITCSRRRKTETAITQMILIYSRWLKHLLEICAPMYPAKASSVCCPTQSFTTKYHTSTSS